jgi:hypothetical protein
MALDNIKKVVIKKADLPPISAEDNAYRVRFRVIQGQRYSHWSPINMVPGVVIPAVDQVSIAVDQTNNTVTAVWSPPAEYDIDTVYVYIRWTDHLQPSLPYEWKYVAKVSSTTYATVIPTTVELTDTISFTPTRIEVAVQAPTYPRVRSADAELFSSDPKAV